MHPDHPPSSDSATPTFEYTGRIYVRPIGRGVILDDLPQQPHLDDVLEEGSYRAVIRVYSEAATPPAAGAHDLP